MELTWDTARDGIRFGQWRDAVTGLRLHVVVEGLPCSNDWDWEVWVPTVPRIVRRGVARSAMEASVAALDAAEQCLRDAEGGSGP